MSLVIHKMPFSMLPPQPPMKARLPLVVLLGALSYRLTLFLLPPQQPHLSLKFSPMRCCFLCLHS